MNRRPLLAGRRWVWVIAIVTYAAAACGGVAAQPDPQLRDGTAVVEDSRFRFAVQDNPGNPPFIGLVHAPEGWDLTAAWEALPCQTSPDVRVSQNESGRLRILVDPGPEPGVCTSDQAFHAVDLRLTQQVDPSNVKVTFKK